MTTLRGGTSTTPAGDVSAGQDPDPRVPRSQSGRNRVSAGQRLAYHRTHVAYHPSDLRERAVVRRQPNGRLHTATTTWGRWSHERVTLGGPWRDPAESLGPC